MKQADKATAAVKGNDVAGFVYINMNKHVSVVNMMTTPFDQVNHRK